MSEEIAPTGAEFETTTFHSPVAIACDGGIGGGVNGKAKWGKIAYCWLWTSDDTDDFIVIGQTSRIITPSTLYCDELDAVYQGGVTSNQAEWYAMYILLCTLPPGWSGPVACDSKVTLSRYFGDRAFREDTPGIHPTLLAQARGALARLGKVEPIWVDRDSDKEWHWQVFANRLCDKMGGAVGKAFQLPPMPE